MTLPNDVEYDFRCQACGGEFFGDRKPVQRWCHDCAQELLPLALDVCEFVRGQLAKTCGFYESKAKLREILDRAEMHKRA